MTRLFLFVLLCSAAFYGCKKDSPGLPPATQEGKNTLGCLINGNIYATQGTKPDLFSVNYVDFTMSPDSVMTVSASRLDPRKDISFSFRITASGTGSYAMTAGYYSEYASGGNLPSNTWQIEGARTGTVSISYYNGAVLAGSFEGDMVSQDGSVVHITSGRFDIRPE